MQDNNITHRFYVPLGCTFSWVLGICLGGDFFDLFGHKNISLANNPHMLLFYSAISVYFSFLLECVFVFIDCGAIYKEERFSGKIFNLLAGIIFHFFLKSATYRVQWDFACKATKFILLYIFLAQQKCRRHKIPLPHKAT